MHVMYEICKSYFNYMLNISILCNYVHYEHSSLRVRQAKEALLTAVLDGCSTGFLSMYVSVFDEPHRNLKDCIRRVDGVPLVSNVFPCLSWQCLRAAPVRSWRYEELRLSCELVWHYSV